MDDDRELRRFFVEEAGVGMSPGTLFGDEGSGFMRMNIGAPRRIIKNALENIRKARNRMSGSAPVGEIS
jgi:cysteine-S-conjugate beta-lyase